MSAPRTDGTGRASNRHRTRLRGDGEGKRGDVLDGRRTALEVYQLPEEPDRKEKEREGRNARVLEHPGRAQVRGEVVRDVEQDCARQGGKYYRVGTQGALSRAEALLNTRLPVAPGTVWERARGPSTAWAGERARRSAERSPK